jgi:uncharacterized RDD family membrane protein YckC
MAEPPASRRGGDPLAARIIGTGAKGAGRLAGATGVNHAIDGAVEEAIVRAMESPAVERALIRLAEEGRLQAALERAAVSADPEDVIGRAIESEAADRIWADILASDKAQMLVERVAEAPEVRAAIAQQGFGLVSDIGRQVSRITEAVDDVLEMAVEKLGLSTHHDEEAEEAGLITRGVAFLIDAALTFALLSLVGAVIASIVPFAFGDGGGLPAWAILLLVTVGLGAAGTLLVTFWYLVGQTPGMRFLGVKLVLDGGGEVPLRLTVRRVLLLPLSLAPAGLGMLAVLRSPKRQAWHDRAAHTVVVYDERSAPWSGIEGGRPQLQNRSRRHGPRRHSRDAEEGDGPSRAEPGRPADD